MTMPAKDPVSYRDENVVYFNLGEDTMYFNGEEYTLLPKGDVMELPTVSFEKELK